MFVFVWRFKIKASMSAPVCQNSRKFVKEIGRKIENPWWNFISKNTISTIEVKFKTVINRISKLKWKPKKNSLCKHALLNLTHVVWNIKQLLQSKFQLYKYSSICISFTGLFIGLGFIFDLFFSKIFNEIGHFCIEKHHYLHIKTD
jgi:UV DNA damage repair endonuclease